MPRARSPKIVFRKPLERSNPHQCPETPRKSEGDRDTWITAVLYPRKYLNPKPFKTHFTSPALQTDVSSEFQPISNTLSQGAVSLQPQDAQCSSPPLPPQPHSFPNSVSDLGCVYKTGSREDRDVAAAGMAGLQNVQKRPEARHCPPAPSPINSNKLFIAQQKKNAAPLPPAKPRNVCSTRRLPPIPPPAPAGEPALYPGKGNGSDYYTHYPTAPRLLKKNKSLFCARNKRRYLN